MSGENMIPQATKEMTAVGLPPIASQDPVEDFFTTSKALLQSIHYFFEDCEKTKDAMLQMEMIETSNMRAMKEILLDKWYETLKPYFSDVAQRNDNAISRANIEMLDRLDIKQKWAQFEHEDKEVMWGYIFRLTQLACLHKETTPEAMRGARLVASRLAERVDLDFTGNRASFDVSTFHAMLSDPGALFQEMQPMLEAVLGQQGEGAPGLNEFMASQMTQFQSLLGGLSQDGSSGSAPNASQGVPAISEEQLKQMMSVMSNLKPPEEVD